MCLPQCHILIRFQSALAADRTYILRPVRSRHLGLQVQAGRESLVTVDDSALGCEGTCNRVAESGAAILRPNQQPVQVDEMASSNRYRPVEQGAIDSPIKFSELVRPAR